MPPLPLPTPRSSWIPSTIIRRFFPHHHLSAGQLVTLGAMGLIVAGTFLLKTPLATTPGKPLSFLNALFTATSAVTVTGLIVADTEKDFTLFGKIVILTLIQLGGLGYAMLATLLLIAVGQRIGLRNRMMVAEAFSSLDLAGLIRFVKTILIITFTLEGVGALILAARFSQDMPVLAALGHGIFHAISAFNNAGFSTFSRNLIPYGGDFIVNASITLLLVLGGIGFIVFRDLLEFYQKKRYRIQTHTRLALLISIGLWVIGTIGFFLLEMNSPATLGSQTPSAGAMVAAFHSGAARTAGFNTLDLSLLRPSTLYMLILLMIIGGSPGGTAGGIKTTTFGIVCLSVWAVFRKRLDVEFHYRRMPSHLVLQALAIMFLAIGAVTTLTFFLAFIENKPFLALMFEVASALGTVGFSVGNGGVLSLSATLTDFGKVIILCSMLLGRFGPLLVGLVSLTPPVRMLYRFPQAKVAIG
ncbi:MAG TPA: TrkH family potassium uptake protein [Nitrospirales bacterium]|nr:TrkH family potassium uptake protein [Nitrospirales bacterium]